MGRISWSPNSTDCQHTSTSKDIAGQGEDGDEGEDGVEEEEDEAEMSSWVNEWSAVGKKEMR